MDPQTPQPLLSPGLGLGRDMALIVAFTALIVALAAHFEWNERLFELTRRWEHIQLDEWPIAAFALTLGFGWLSWRRYRQTLDQLQARRRAEALLAGALAENRRLAQHYLIATERDQKHLARELHDELGQYSNAIKLDAVALRDAPSMDDIHSAGERIVVAVDHMHTVLSDIIRRLRPAGLDELGLVAALENCIDLWRQRRPGTRFSLRTSGPLDELGETVRLTIYRVVQEALTNSSRHAEAGRIDINVRRDPDAPDRRQEVSVLVSDDGRGVDMQDFQPGFGLSGMRERVELAGGTLQLDGATGQGFSLQARLPATASP
jgi:two-component system sensor histidine kinase UhpB